MFPTQITVPHILATAAIPFLFSPVMVEGRYHVDGGLRLNTPLRPSIRAGARRVLVVSVKRDIPQIQPLEHVTPTLAFLAGKTLNAVLLDPVERDLRHLERLNQVIEWGAREYGPDFVRALDRDLDLRPVDTLYIRPSEDLGRMAREIYKASPPDVPPTIRALLALMADQVNADESDLLSYLFFIRSFTAELEQLAFEDARRRESDLLAFFGT